ncbi:MAG: oxalyl-CoA decarboxylase [Chloroflexi bacterium]|nr:oxalyl-CoA decarboxylase [Chloroflexota bacterium]MDA1002912.1 oxalyl-CoA decarboxylase [Chloroflexota bacterium]
MTTETAQSAGATSTGASTITGARLLARCLKQQGVDFIFGVVGFPITDFAVDAQREGIRYIGMRNEQAASYAAQAAGYLTGRPQGCAVVSGPGVIHALAGLANAKSNLWPMILIGGASAIAQNGMGAFQEENQVLAAYPLSKYAHAIERADRIPYYVEQAVRATIYGRPGPAYLDLPDDVFTAEVDESAIRYAPVVPDPPRSAAPAENIEAALKTLKSAENPLVIVGKGMAWARAEDEVRDFIERTQLPFLATPMGKGVVPDEHPLSVGAARTLALQQADVIVLLGARLNWILHFGLEPRYRKDVRVIQLDIAAEEIGTNVPAEVALVGDGKAIVGQLNAALEQAPWQYPVETTWRSQLQQKIDANALVSAELTADRSTPMNYYVALQAVQDAMPRDTIIVSEGASTMDIGRTILMNHSARTRLDAGSYGTMGVGMGFAIAASVVNPGMRIVAVEGDAAFGFSGMELETMARYNLPITTVIINNNGIGGGLTELPKNRQSPPSVLLPGARYEKIAEAFGARGYYVTEPDDLPGVLAEANSGEGPTIVNVAIATQARRKPQQFGWHT